MSPILPTGGVLRSTPAFAVVILAAGASRRLGRSKALVQRAGQALVRHQVERAIAAGALWVGVTVGRLAPLLRTALTGSNTHLIAVPRWRRGMGESVAAAARAAPPNLRLVLIATDQWRLTAADIRRLGTAAHRELTAASYGGARGIPAAFPPRYRRTLAGIRGDQGARSLLAAAHLIPLENAQDDLDTPADLANLQRRWPSWRRAAR
jgi:molybdenum cofactor cytidylyltransferase